MGALPVRLGLETGPPRPSEVAYGGRVDNVYDSILLRTFVDHLFREEMFNADFQMNKSAVRDQGRLH